MRISRTSQPQYINCRYQCQLSHVTPGHAFLVAVCIVMLPVLEVATGHVQLKTTGNGKPHHMIKHAPLLLPFLHSVQPAMVLQNDIVKSNLWCLSCFSSSVSVNCDRPCLGFNISSDLGRRVVGVVVVLLLLMSGDVETNPGPVGEFMCSSRYTVRNDGMQVSLIHNPVSSDHSECYGV